MIPVWNLHMNPALWGPDTHIFNPERDWLPEERYDRIDKAGNPQSHRYAPFAFTPRDCIGKNFAQMEARIILAYFFHRFEVELAEPTLSRAEKARGRTTFFGDNRGTMGPQGGLWVHLNRRG